MQPFFPFLFPGMFTFRDFQGQACLFPTILCEKVSELGFVGLKDEQDDFQEISFKS